MEWGMVVYSSASFSSSQSLLARDLVSVISLCSFSMDFLSLGMVFTIFFVKRMRFKYKLRRCCGISL